MATEIEELELKLDTLNTSEALELNGLLPTTPLVPAIGVIVVTAVVNGITGCQAFYEETDSRYR